MTGGQAREGQPVVPEDEQELMSEIARVRQQVGQTVEELTAKADLKGIARAKAAGAFKRMSALAGKAGGRTSTRALLAAGAAAVAASFLMSRWWRNR